MNIKIGSVFSLSVNIIPQRDIQRFCFKFFPFIIREIKIGDLFNVTSGISYVKILDEFIPEITPKVKITINKLTLEEILRGGFLNLEHFFSYTGNKKNYIYLGNEEFFIATSGREIVYFAMLGYAKKARLMISKVKTLASFRGKYINPAALVYIMKYLRDSKKADRVYISTSGTNINMQKSILRAGFKIDLIFYKISFFRGRVEPV
ncbi:MAG: hypothetical protein ABIH40_06865 [Candidatus Omnitrophota bacterium]